MSSPPRARAAPPPPAFNAPATLDADIELAQQMGELRQLRQAIAGDPTLAAGGWGCSSMHSPPLPPGPSSTHMSRTMRSWCRTTIGRKMRTDSHSSTSSSSH